ncbi:FAD linked oxidase domain protein [Methanohalobium evestigatum Z-7303]|uniref:FAD linked oxidase domain protein n=1 Tax=Methanohalobium evestigatum (strain ATCC BAA-1072 / DSM 3721 / NBRC 107634 / OCM 161 / Z-7303) TaxID=644295 RepID=D7EA15_METEZ|nr:FAD-binding and (Fe-S)-binding domain-containing protein [Methanohalobium evestigatum]ADI74686.1 FAD linked oxidase domain protein [Methanohalobium evestigatum Z-7303]
MVKHISELSGEQKSELSNIFGPHVNFKKRERHYYGHDIGTLPTLVKPMLGKSEPSAVVKVENEDEAVKLIKFANKYNIPVVPRAGASSGYGGVIPTKGGIVADITTMNQIQDIDHENLKATVGAGIRWERLEKKLNNQGLSVQALPTSAPSSTVGGWLAQNGIGFGSFEYGWSQNTMESARVVLPTGEVKEFSGDQIKNLTGTMGTTGIISQITLKLRNYEDTKGISAEFKDAESLKKAIHSADEQNIPLWSVTFLNPNWVELKNKTPEKHQHGRSDKIPNPELPVAYVCNFLYPESRENDVRPLKDIIQNSGGKVLPDKIAEHEINESYKSMKIKRLGPSFIPAEVLVPLENMDKVFDEINNHIDLPVLVEGMMSNDGYVVLLCFMRHSERSLKFNTAFPLSLSIVNIAEKYGGRIYSSGLYFAQKAESVFADNYRDIQNFKKQHDPNDLMNPDTLTGKSGLNTAISLGEKFEPLGRMIGNKSGIGSEKFTKEEKGIPPEVVELAYSCSQCGYCVSECDQYYGRGWESQSPRGKWFFIKEYLAGRDELDQGQTNTFLSCTTCEMCDTRCELNMPIEQSWRKLRPKLVQEKEMMTIPPFEIMAQSLLKERNIWANYMKNRADWIPDDLKEKISDESKYGYFAGCTASFVEKDIAVGTARMLDDADIDFTVLGDKESCCGIPMLMAGKWDVFEKIMKMNISNMKSKGVETVITSCPACWMMWHDVYPEWAEKLGIEYNFEVKHYSEVLVDKLDVLKPKLKQPLNKVVTWHDSCHIGRAGGVYEPPRQLLKSVPGVEFKELENNRDKAHCCGSVMTLVADPHVAHNVANIRLDEAKDVNADVVATLCPCCLVQFRTAVDEYNLNMDIQDLGAIVARSLGYDIPDSTQDTLDAWLTFDKMIELLQPQNMADMMEELMPEMMEAMPSYLKPMMKSVKYVPGMDALMKPMMPKMMPMLMPSIMPKVMPSMLKAVEKRVPMPDYIKEQMPDLMPKAMENLMPNMLPQLIPYLTPKMIEYIKKN